MPRTAVVTGGGTGIGKAVAAAFASDGLDVVVTGRAMPRPSLVGALGPIRPVTGCTR